MTSSLAVLRLDGAGCSTRKSQAVPGCGAEILMATGLGKLWLGGWVSKGGGRDAAAAGQSCFLSTTGPGACNSQQKVWLCSVGWGAGMKQALAVHPQSFSIPHHALVTPVSLWFP